MNNRYRRGTTIEGSIVRAEGFITGKLRRDTAMITIEPTIHKSTRRFVAVKDRAEAFRPRSSIEQRT